MKHETQLGAHSKHFIILLYVTIIKYQHLKSTFYCMGIFVTKCDLEVKLLV